MYQEIYQYFYERAMEHDVLPFWIAGISAVLVLWVILRVLLQRIALYVPLALQALALLGCVAGAVINSELISHAFIAATVLLSWSFAARAGLKRRDEKISIYVICLAIAALAVIYFLLDGKFFWLKTIYVAVAGSFLGFLAYSLFSGRTKHPISAYEASSSSAAVTLLAAIFLTPAICALNATSELEQAQAYLSHIYEQISEHFYETLISIAILPVALFFSSAMKSQSEDNWQEKHHNGRKVYVKSQSQHEFDSWATMILPAVVIGVVVYALWRIWVVIEFIFMCVLGFAGFIFALFALWYIIDGPYKKLLLKKYPNALETPEEIKQIEG